MAFTAHATGIRYGKRFKPLAPLEEEISMDDTTFLNVLKSTVENHGCTIIDVDLEKHIINLDGPDEAVAACALAISELVERI